MVILAYSAQPWLSMSDLVIFTGSTGFTLSWHHFVCLACLRFDPVVGYCGAPSLLMLQYRYWLLALLCTGNGRKVAMGNGHCSSLLSAGCLGERESQGERVNSHSQFRPAARDRERGAAADADSRPAGFMLPSAREYLQRDRRVIWEESSGCGVSFGAALVTMHNWFNVFYMLICLSFSFCQFQILFILFTVHVLLVEDKLLIGYL